MKNKINKAFEKKRKMKLMTHVVAGYPTLKKSEEIIRCMAQNGVDMIEIQIPFSDPLADGPTIMKANQVALENGITPMDCFELVDRITDSIEIPVLFMTYANIPFRMGMQEFIINSSQAGASGLIIPDLPYDEDIGDYYKIAKKNDVHAIYVISPDISETRLKNICDDAEGFIYTTLKKGITGAGNQIQKKGLDFINFVKAHSSIPIAAGFGISTTQHLEMLHDIADMAVIGSHVINLYNENGISGVDSFLTRIIHQIH